MFVGKMSPQYLGCDVVPEAVLGDGSGGGRASLSHSTVSRCRHHYYFTIYVSNMYKWNSKRR